MILSVLAMYGIGLYCNLMFSALVSPQEAYDVNSMFILHSPFEGVPFILPSRACPSCAILS